MIKGKKQQKKICHSEFISESCNRNGGQMLNLFWHDKSLPKAFTLAELLIALAILGLIAVLTIPFVAGNLFAKSYRAKAEAARETVLGAINSVYMTERVHSIEDSSVYNDKEQFFHRYIKTAKHCGTDAGKCFGENYKTGDGNFALSDLLASDSKYYVVFSNGASVGVYTGGEVPKGQVYFVVDANGKGRPNQLGVDTYAFAVFGDGTAGSFGDFNDILAYVDQSLPDNPGNPGGPGSGGSDPEDPEIVVTNHDDPEGPCASGLYQCTMTFKCNGTDILSSTRPTMYPESAQCPVASTAYIGPNAGEGTPASSMTKEQIKAMCSGGNVSQVVSKTCYGGNSDPNPSNPDGQCPGGSFYCSVDWKCNGNVILSGASKNPVTNIAQCVPDINQPESLMAMYTLSDTPTNALAKCSNATPTATISKACERPTITEPEDNNERFCSCEMNSTYLTERPDWIADHLPHSSGTYEPLCIYKGTGEITYNNPRYLLPGKTTQSYGCVYTLPVAGTTCPQPPQTVTVNYQHIDTNMPGEVQGSEFECHATRGLPYCTIRMQSQYQDTLGDTQCSKGAEGRCGFRHQYFMYCPADDPGFDPNDSSTWSGHWNYPPANP